MPALARAYKTLLNEVVGKIISEWAETSKQPSAIGKKVRGNTHSFSLGRGRINELENSL
jgi:hypothetical protein